MFETAPQVPELDALVSIGLPVRNGAAFLAGALDSLLSQTHSNLEIVVSDNASTDATQEIARSYAARDGRIRYIRHAAPMDAARNFRFAFEQASSEWFCWASHDDRRAPDFVAEMLRAFRSNPDAVITVPRVIYFRHHDKLRDAEEIWEHPRLVPLRGVAFPERHHVLVGNGPCQIYGMMRASALRHYSWPALPSGVDWMILHWLAAVGEVVTVPSAVFYYYVAPRPKSAEEANAYHAYHWLRPARWTDTPYLPEVQWAYVASRELAEAWTDRGVPMSRARLFPMLCFLHHGGVVAWGRRALYEISGPRTRQLWRHVKARWASGIRA